MSKKSPLSNVVGSIRSNQSRVIPKDQTFDRPETPVKELPQDLKVTLPPDEKITQDELRTEDRKTPSDTQGTLGTASTVDQNEASGEKSSQDQKPPIPQKNRLTQEEKLALTLEKLKKGFTNIPNCILMEILYGDVSKAEIKILLLIARYTLSFNKRRTASLSKADIERYTKLQGKSILEALALLVEKNLIIKIKGDQYSANQLGLVYASEIFEPQGTKKQTDPKGASVPEVTNSPQDAKVTNPLGEIVTHPSDTKVTSPADQKSTHFKLSSSNDLSLSCKFPDDMTARWREFERLGKFANSQKEREIFQELFIAHKQEFFNYCARVVAFLEENGNGKTGEEGKVYNPMAYLRGHWEHNFNRYLTWLKKSKELEAEQVQEAEAATKRKKDQELFVQTRDQEQRLRVARDAELQADIQQLLGAFPGETELDAFINQAVEQSRCEFTLNSWRKQGWESPVVKTCVVSHFQKLKEAGFLSASRPSDQEIA